MHLPNGLFMQERNYANLILELKNVCLALEPSAHSRRIELNFFSAEQKIQFSFDTVAMRTGLYDLINSILEYMPTNNRIDITADIITEKISKYVSIKIHNTGINLKMVSALINKSVLPVKLFSSDINETTFEVCYTLETLSENESVKPHLKNGAWWNYLSVVNGIKSHFAKLNNHVERLAEIKPKEAAFLTNINNCILKNLADEQFDANALSSKMAMSRSQLLRRLKSSIGNSPGYYIKTLRIEKAKQLLETSDLSICEVAYETGFSTASNFSKVFCEKYGITPSQFRHGRKNATNE